MFMFDVVYIEWLMIEIIRWFDFVGFVILFWCWVVECILVWFN